MRTNEQGAPLHWSAKAEDRWLAVANRQLRHFGWLPRIEPFTSLGNPSRVRVLARLLLSPYHRHHHREPVRRGFRSYLAIAAPYRPVTITVGAVTVETTTDRGGYLDVTISMPEGQELKPGWRTVSLATAEPGVPAAIGQLRIIGTEVQTGVISDIDDTAMVTMVPDLVLATWNTLLAPTASRKAVHGMAPLYQELARAHPRAAFVYLSNGAWNTARTLRRFLARAGYPAGPMLLTDFGPTNNGFFRSGRAHKTQSIAWLMEMFPQVNWILVGDDGQKDPDIYTEAALHFPDRVRAIAIRTLSASERVFSPRASWRSQPLPEGLPLPAEDAPESVTPLVIGADGDALAERLRECGVLPPATAHR